MDGYKYLMQTYRGLLIPLNSASSLLTGCLKLETVFAYLGSHEEHSLLAPLQE